MEHIITRHMQPVKSGKSYFLSRDVTKVANLITQATSTPGQILTHKNDKNKRVFKKNFPFTIGVHGRKRQPCYGIIVIVDSTDSRLITAYPTLKWQLYFCAYNRLFCFGTRNIVDKADHRVIHEFCDHYAGALQLVK